MCVIVICWMVELLDVRLLSYWIIEFLDSCNVVLLGIGLFD